MRSIIALTLKIFKSAKMYMKTVKTWLNKPSSNARARSSCRSMSASRANQKDKFMQGDCAVSATTRQI